MPMYRYHCNTCDKDFNVLELANDPPTTICECEKKSTDIQKILGVPSLAFKGKGFYVSDKRATSGKTSTKKKDDKSPETKTKSDGKTGKKESTKKVAS